MPQMFKAFMCKVLFFKLKMMNNRKFSVAILLIIAGVLFLVLGIRWNNLLSVAVPYYTFLGVIGSGFFAANVGEHMAKNKGVENAGNLPDTSKPV